MNKDIIDIKAVVLDTNILISNRSKLILLVEKLSESYNVYISEVSLKERLSHLYLELKDKYENINQVRDKYSDLVNIEFKYSFEELYKIKETRMEKSYSDLFNNKLINLNPNEDIFNIVLDRALKKIPPFSNAEGASDKGFKDTLIWLSILQYFIKKEEENIIFITDDKYFIKYSVTLGNEFNKKTGKNLVIKDNSFIEALINPTEEASTPQTKPMSDIETLRESIQDKIPALCGYYEDDDFGNTYWCKTFELHVLATPAYVEKIFINLQNSIEQNLFEYYLQPTTAFGLFGLTDIHPIPMGALNSALSLYINIRKDYNVYLPQFFRTVANIFNNNYIEDNSFEVPF